MTDTTASSKTIESKGSADKPAGPLAPFKHPAFAVLWVATVASNVGTWMHDVGAGWLMTELAPSPMMVAAVQAATTLPIFLFALLAGAVADIVDRRKLLIIVNLGLGVAALAMTFLVHSGLMTAWLLLVFTFLFGTGAAFIAPAWQAIVPKLVPKKDLPSAIAMNSMGINISRAIGPALAGFLIVAAGLAAPFLVNALSFIGIIAAVIWWKPAPAPVDTLPKEKIGGAIQAGLQYAFNSPPLRAALLRAFGFFVFASAFWAMLPLIARNELGGGPTLYGIMLAAVGAGAVGGAFLLPKIKGKLGADGTVMAGTIGTAVVMLVMALVPNQIAAVGVSVLAGLSWIAVLSTLNVAAQTSLPDWVRARGLSVFLTVFFGSMSLGSLAWGQVASHWGVPVALIVAGIGIVLMIPLTRGAKLQRSQALDLSPSMHWPEPVVVSDEIPDGPVMTQIIYRVDEVNKEAFLALMQDLAGSRRRGGGYRWSVMRDAADPTLFVETWWEGSWLAHERQHHHVSKDDQALQERIRALQIDQAKPSVTHFLSAE